MVELVRAERAPEELAKEFQPSAQSIRTWVRQRPSAPTGAFGAAVL